MAEDFRAENIVEHGGVDEANASELNVTVGGQREDDEKMVEDENEGTEFEDENEGTEFEDENEGTEFEDDAVGKVLVDEDKPLGVDYGDYEFCIGDIVWVETKTKTWWPGRIHDPVVASDYGMVSDQEGCLLVEYFAMGNVAWCLRHQLKPFAQFFEQISGQSKARIFVRAVAKSLEEFGDRVRLNMTCACVLERKQSVDEAASEEGVTVTERNSSELGEFSVTQFDCVEFLAHLKSLAQVVSKVGMIDFTVTQSRLSAFYSSTGHSQLPIHLLHDVNDAESGAYGTLLKQTEENILHQEKNDENETFGEGFGGSSDDKTSISRLNVRKRKMTRDSEIEITSLPISPKVKESNAGRIGNGDGRNEGMIEMGPESRERKRSRYLSYPYVNIGQKGLSVEGIAVILDNGAPLNFKSTGEKFWRKWYMRFTCGRTISGSSNLNNISTAEVLSEFCSAAINCQYPIENKAFSSIAWFISNFRISVFHNEPLCENYSNYMDGKAEDKDAEPWPLENGEQNEGNSEPKKRTKKTVSKNAEGEVAANTSSLIQSPTTFVQGMDENFGKKRGQPKLGRPKTKSLSGISDFNTSIARDGQMVQGSLAVGPFMPCYKPKQKTKEKADGASQASLMTTQTFGIPDLNGNSVIPTVLVNGEQTIGHAASEHLKSNMAPYLVDSNGNNLKPGTLIVDLGIPGPAFPYLDPNQVTSFVSAESKPAPKKRKRKEKVDPGVPVQTNGIPDLNGNVAECLTPPSKPVQKRRRRKGEALATALLLSFAPGVPLPSKDDLISTFCKYGPLKESETQFLKDPSSAQVVFMESADAGEAFQSLEKNNPFGTNLVGYKRFNLPSVSKDFATSLASPGTVGLLSPVQSPAKGPNLDIIRQNLQMMTSMLEKSGDTLSPEMRAKLECEIKGLLQKVISTDGASSVK